MADNENPNVENIEPVEMAAEEQEPDEEFETIPVAELLDVKLGRQGENDTQTVVIDCSAWLTQLPGCTFMIAATRPGEREIYLPEVTVSGGVITWPILEQDTACAGTGRAEVRAMKDDKVKKSALFRTRVEPALEGDGSPDAPTPPNWVRLIIESVEEAQQAAETAQGQVQGALEAAEAAQESAEAAQEAAEGAVCYNAAQALTDAHRKQARENVGIPDVMVSRFSGQKVSIIGDSISTFDAAGYRTDDYVQYYPRAGVTDPALTEPAQTWWMRVINASGARLEVNASASGSLATNYRMSWTPVNSTDFYERCNMLGSPDLIFVALGTNDSVAGVALGEYDYETAYASLSEATFRTAYIKGLKALMANYPAAKIVPVIFHMGDSYAESIMEIGESLDIEVVDARSYQDYSNTGHPGVTGMREISSTVLYHADPELRTEGVPADAAAVGHEIHVLELALGAGLNMKVDADQGSENAGKVLLVGADGGVAPGRAQNGFNDAFRHYLEGALRAGMFTADVSVMITRLAAAMLGVDGVVQSGDTLTVNYSLNDPEKTGAALVFS